MQSVTFGDKLTTIGNSAFINSGITSVSFPASLTSIGNQTTTSTAVSVKQNGTFYNCANLASVTFAENGKLTNIPAEAFGACSSLTEIHFPAYVASIQPNAIYGCKALTTLEFPANPAFTTITKNFASKSMLGANQLTNSNLTTVIVPANVTTIEENAFQYGSIGTVELPGVQKIGSYAFDHNKLTSVTMSSATQSIGTQAFGNANLTDVYTYNAVPPTIAANTFNDYTYRNAKLHVLNGTTELYQNADNWKNFANLDPDTLTGVEDVAADAADGFVEIYSLDGRRVYAGAADEAPALSGLYIVRTGSAERKVMF